MTISMNLLSGPAIEECLEGMATLRIEIFREYPYLYDGKRKDEITYLRHYAAAEGACVLTVVDDGTIVGAATGIPLSAEDRALVKSFANTIYLVEEIYYVGELLFYPSYRKSGLGTGLVALIEEHVRSLGKYNYLTCATVVRPDDHPLRSPDYIPIDIFLARTGFTRLPNISTSFNWLEIDGGKRDHLLQFWIKDLR